MVSEAVLLRWLNNDGDGRRVGQPSPSSRPTGQRRPPSPAAGVFRRSGAGRDGSRGRDGRGSRTARGRASPTKHAGAAPAQQALPRLPADLLQPRAPPPPRRATPERKSGHRTAHSPRSALGLAPRAAHGVETGSTRPPSERPGTGGLRKTFRATSTARLNAPTMPSARPNRRRGAAPKIGAPATRPPRPRPAGAGSQARSRSMRRRQAVPMSRPQADRPDSPAQQPPPSSRRSTRSPPNSGAPRQVQ